jgi:hypothetical protein
MGGQMSTPIDDRNDHVRRDDAARTERLPRDGSADETLSTDRHDVVDREKEAFGGIKFGSAFFGWLAATGMVALLTAIIAGTGTALGLGVTEENADTVSLVGAIVLLVVLFIGYYCGGYVAGRMARFSGAKQGIAVWLWAIVMAILIAVVGAIAGAQFNILASLNAFPRIPINEGDLTTVGIITAIVVAIVSLIGAILGGLAGMRFHRKVDRAGLGD